MKAFFATLPKKRGVFLQNVRQCYSLRKAQQDYTGNCGIIKRMSDGETLTVGFDSNNELDTNIVDAFDNGSDLRMIEWFNQGTFQTLTSVSNPTDTECPLLKRNGNYFELNGKKTLFFENGNWLRSLVADQTLQSKNMGLVYAGTQAVQVVLGSSISNAGVFFRIAYVNLINRAVRTMGGDGSEFQEHSLEVPLNTQQISLMHFGDERSQSVNGIIETSPRTIFLGSNPANVTVINAGRHINVGANDRKPSFIQEVFFQGFSAFSPNLVEQANEYYKTY